MNHDFKVGDLAVIIAGGDFPNNIGKCVELIQFIEPRSHYVEPMEGRAVFNNTDMHVWLVLGDVESDVLHGATQKAPENLMPLRGDFQPEREREKELTE